MIASLTGQVKDRDARSLVLDIHGVGMRVEVLPRVFDRAPAGSSVTLWTHLYVREDALELYGFLERNELQLFQQLIEISGVGPRMAMGVLSAASVKDLEAAIELGQSTVLTKVSGVGKKTAERIILELRGKLADVMPGDDSDLSATIDALTSLGYSAREAREAAVATPPEMSVGDRVKTALKQLGR